MHLFNFSYFFNALLISTIDSDFLIFFNSYFFQEKAARVSIGSYFPAFSHGFDVGMAQQFIQNEFLSRVRTDKSVQYIGLFIIIYIYICNSIIFFHYFFRVFMFKIV